MFGDPKLLEDLARKVPLQQLHLSWLRSAGIDLWVRRDDLIHPTQSGNKFYKLFFNLQQAREQGCSQIASFGGAWSNHLHALAAAGKDLGIKTLGVVRGQMPEVLSDCLVDAQSWGMELKFITRESYRDKLSAQSQVVAQARQGDIFWVPEGGANLAGAAGMQVLGRVLEEQLNGRPADICIACGTATSLAGVAAGVSANRRVLGFPVLKAGAGVQTLSMVNTLMQGLGELRPAQNLNWRLLWGFHGGGYGRKPRAELFEFWREFEGDTGIALDPVYTLKLIWGIYSLARQGYWPRGSQLVAIHTGGLQGRRGFVCP